MNIMESIFYGLISGITEILPISSQAHQAFVLRIFGLGQRQPLIDLGVHLGVLLAIFFGCFSSIARLRRDMRNAAQRGRRGMRHMNLQSIYDMRLLRTAAIPMCISLFSYLFFARLEWQMMWLVLAWLINGLVLYIIGHIRQGNKESRAMSGMDAIFMGLAGALSAIPGLSRVGMITSAAMLRGASRNYALNWALLLSIPAVLIFVLLDLIGIFSVGTAVLTFSGFLSFLFSAIAAFVGGYFSIILVQFLIVRFDLSGFSYYCWGVAMLSFILYLII